MATQRTFHRVLGLSAAVAALLLPLTPKAIAANADDEPFAKSCEVADAALDTMRGGFHSPKDGIKVPFGLEVHFESVANKKDIANLTITNDGDKNHDVKVTQNGFTVTQTGNLVSTTNIAPGQTVTTSITGQGILTVIQNTRSNTVLQTVQTLNATITGMKDLMRITARNNLHTSRVLFH
jgi:hypothetical protein